MKNASIPVAFLLCLIFYGCERAVEFELKEEAPKLVVEATIENDEPPMVTLTRSVGFFSNLTFQILSQSFVHDAQVFISNGTRTHKLKEYTVPVLPGINLYYYSIDSADLATAFEGEINKQYSLRVVSEGQEYTATTEIPDFGKTIDSLWWKPAPASEDTNKVVIMARITDPPGYGDYARVFTRTNDQPRFLPPYVSVFDDLFIDGTTYEVQLEGGVDRNADTTDDDFFFKGDTVDLKVSTINKATYDFWRTWEFSYSSIGNPFSTPVKVLGNISNNALGYFGGYASRYRRLIVK